MHDDSNAPVFCTCCGVQAAGSVCPGCGGPLHALRVGSLAVAKRACAVFDLGEPGVCYESYRVGGRPGWSFVFARGGFDGFSPQDVALCLHLTGEVAPELAGYRFRSVGQLRVDHDAGRFVAAFARVLAGREGRA
jgi:hypothetical protein